MDNQTSQRSVAILLFLGLAAVVAIALLTTGGDSTDSTAGGGEPVAEEDVEQAVESPAGDVDDDEDVVTAVEGEAVTSSEAPETSAPDATTTSTTTTTTAPETTTAPTTTTPSSVAAAPTTPTTPAPTPALVPAPTLPATDNAPDETETAEETEADETDAAAGSDAEAVGDEAASEDSAFFPNDPFPGQVLFANGEFVRLDSGPSGFEFGRSPNGEDWVLEPTSGLPANGFVQSIVPSAEGLVAVVEVFSDVADPFQIVVESGLLTDAEINSLCDLIVDGLGEPVVVTTCDFDELDAAFEEFEDALENAESEAARIELEEDFIEFESQFFEGVEVLRLVPGDEFYDEVVEAFVAQEESFDEGPEQVVATSADGLSWVAADLPRIPVEDGGFVFINSAAVSGDRLAVLLSVEPAFVDPFEALADSGLLTEDELENICGFESGDVGDPIIITSCDFSGTDEDDFEEAEILRLEPGDELYEQLLDSFFGETEGMPAVIAGVIGGEMEIVELPIQGFPNSIVGTDAGFLATVFNFDGESTVLTSSNGLTWTPVERFQDDDAGSTTSDVAIASNSDRVLALIIAANDGPEDNTPQLALTSDDLGATWTESEIPTELFGAFPRPEAGPGGFAFLLEGSTEPFSFSGPEVVEIEQDGFVMEIRLDEDTGGLRTTDGTIIHESVSFEDAFSEGEIPGVLRVEQPDEDAVWLEPETGEVLVVFLFDDIIAAIDQTFQEFEGLNSEPDFVSELWFSADGETWTLLSTFANDGQFTSIAAVGDDEILLLTESFRAQPDDLFAFEEEGREPTPEELAAIDEFFAQQSSFEWSRVVVS